MEEELKFVELLAGEKKPKNFDIKYSNMEELTGAGLMLNDNVVVVDFDNDNGAKEKEIVDYLKISYPDSCNYKTDKGYHFYFSQPSSLFAKNGSDIITVGGFQVDYITGNNRYITVKKNGKERISQEDITLIGLPELPQILYPIGKNKTNLCSMTDGDGRNDGIFKHLCCVRGKYPELSITQIGEYINHNIFGEPLPDNELYSTIDSVMNREINAKEEAVPLETISALELKNTELKPIKFIVEDMLPQGLNIICSPPKYGKSWLMLDLCLSVASGSDFLNHKTKQCNCLYLALEDSKNRLKTRMLSILRGVDPSPNFDFSIRCNSLGSNLIKQLNQYMKAKPHTGLIVIDTLQKIRCSSSKSDSAYGSDYKDLGILKAFADEKEICLLLVHHLRKMNDSGDVFAKISGTNAIMGACDTIFILDREKRSDNETILTMTGRDIEENEYIMEFDKSSCKWNLIGDFESQLQQRQWKEHEEDPIVQTIKTLVKENGEYEGTATDINNKCLELFGNVIELTPAVLSKKIRALTHSLNFYDNIIYTAPPENGKGGKRIHKFTTTIDLSKNTPTADTTDN